MPALCYPPDTTIVQFRGSKSADLELVDIAGTPVYVFLISKKL